MGVYDAVEYCAASGLVYEVSVHIRDEWWGSFTLIEDAFELESWDESFWIRIEIAHIDTVKPNTTQSSRYDFFLTEVNAILADCIWFRRAQDASGQTAAKPKY